MTYAFLIPCLLLLSLVPSKSHNVATLNNTLLTDNNGGFSIPPLIIHHRDSPQSPFYNASMTIYERRIAAAQRSINRIHHLMSMWNVTRRRRTKFADDNSDDDFSTNIVSDGTEYIGTIYLGNPLVKVTLIVDTGSGQNWVKGPPVYDATKSTSYVPRFCHEGCPPRSGCDFLNNLCRYQIEYADDSFSSGIVSNDNFGFDDSDGFVRNIGHFEFGYATESKGFFDKQNGNLGLNRESTSFVFQLEIQKFSHCFVSMDNTKGSRLHFGPSAMVHSDSKISYDPTIDYHYYVTLNRIKVGNKYVLLPPGVFAFNKKTEEGGVIFDIGTTYTRFCQRAYVPFAREMRNQMKVKFVSPIDYFDLCFRGNKRDFGKLPTVMFEFDTLNLTLPKANTYVELARNVWCLGIVPDKTRVNYTDITPFCSTRLTHPQTHVKQTNIPSSAPPSAFLLSLLVADAPIKAGGPLASSFSGALRSPTSSSL
ncbi:Beta-site APP-cleaving enzyme [Stylosanthes scabra]|uniref:Beta-site APP-cleaving enzyme n=1 Tax=Stylosanthes scabra TaxID=79078 RepID=A0ABU6UP98_9FABA|nr:Beta-site APP-cleaving enzyme [Stylosanthes scabra]